jgi:hypothetical protein
MAFKMNKPSITQGTAGHRSATETHLKMSALKAKEDEGSSDMMLDYSYTPDPKAISYSDAYNDNLKWKYPEVTGEHAADHTKVDKHGREYGGTTAERRKQFETAAKAWNMKTYGTHNPTADAKKAGINKEELAKRFKASSTKTPGGGTEATVKSNSKPLNSSDLKGKTVIKDRPMNQDKSRIRNADGTMKSREVRAAEDKARREKEAASKAPKSESKRGQTIITKGKSHTGATTKTVDRGGKVRRVVSKDAQGNKSVVKYDREGNVKKTGKQKRAEKEAKKDAERAENAAENAASNARRSADLAASRASHDKKVAEKESNKRAADKISNDAKTQKYLDSNSKKRFDLNREADRLVAQSGGKLRKGQARRSIKRDNKRTAETTAQNAESTKKANTKKAADALEKDVAASAMKKYKTKY